MTQNNAKVGRYFESNKIIKGLLIHLSEISREDPFIVPKITEINKNIKAQFYDSLTQESYDYRTVSCVNSKIIELTEKEN